MRVELEQTVPHPPARVFAVLADPTRRPEWQENTRDVEDVGPVPVGVGTRWREVQRGIGAVDAEVTGFEPDALWAEQGLSSAGTGRITVRLEPDGEGATRVRMEVEIALKGLKRAMEPAIAPMVRSQIPRDLDRLSALLDAG